MQKSTSLSHIRPVIAVIHRRDNVEDKWIVAPEGMDFSVEEIRKATHFVEQFIDIEIIK